MSKPEITRIRFRLRAPLVTADQQRFLGELVAGPRAPDGAEIGADGVGWVDYLELEPNEGQEIERWLRKHPLVAGVQD